MDATRSDVSGQLVHEMTDPGSWFHPTVASSRRLPTNNNTGTQHRPTRLLCLLHGTVLKTAHSPSLPPPNTGDMDRANTKIVVVGGGGTIGSSTALHLLRGGFTPSNITVLDTYRIPSAQSAGNDLNKIMGVTLRNPVDLKLSLGAKEMWDNDELFKPWFHKTGRVSLSGCSGCLIASRGKTMT